MKLQTDRCAVTRSAACLSFYLFEIRGNLQVYLGDSSFPFYRIYNKHSASVKLSMIIISNHRQLHIKREKTIVML